MSRMEENEHDCHSTEAAEVCGAPWGRLRCRTSVPGKWALTQAHIDASPLWSTYVDHHVTNQLLPLGVSHSLSTFIFSRGWREYLGPLLPQ